MISLLNKTVQNSYFSFFSWGYFYNAGYFTFTKFNRMFFNETLYMSRS